VIHIPAETSLRTSQIVTAS